MLDLLSFGIVDFLRFASKIASLRCSLRWCRNNRAVVDDDVLDAMMPNGRANEVPEARNDQNAREMLEAPNDRINEEELLEAPNGQNDGERVFGADVQSDRQQCSCF
ncbi:unnamed protein product [Cylicocyclus nassatus]|uniref:Uncharacterized protein n=1 Tax=Cylicocyclus nassatus TaxID=53992 RepID=A0AA36H037_CYLNA|nr:unnamed protein product [Cylicocyclus nassatus]